MNSSDFLEAVEEFVETTKNFVKARHNRPNAQGKKYRLKIALLSALQGLVEQSLSVKETKILQLVQGGYF
jgi:hypothetical protein